MEAKTLKHSTESALNFTEQESLMSVTTVWKDNKPGQYVIMSRKVLKLGEIEADISVHFTKGGQEEKLDQIGEYRNLGPPIYLGFSGNLLRLTEEGTLGILAASGLPPEEIEKLKKKM
jgi:hypothetical protein